MRKRKIANLIWLMRKRHKPWNTILFNKFDRYLQKMELVTPPTYNHPLTATLLN